MTTMANVPDPPGGGLTGITMVCPAGTGMLVPAWPATETLDVAAMTLTVAALPGAEMTSWVEPARPDGSAEAMPCSLTAADAGAMAPGAPASPPVITAEAMIGTLAETRRAAATLDSEGSWTVTAEAPGRSMPVPPV